MLGYGRLRIIIPSNYYCTIIAHARMRHVHYEYEYTYLAPFTKNKDQTQWYIVLQYIVLLC